MLRIYRLGQRTPAGPPVDLSTFLATADKASDIEGAARIGDTIYWISSHSRTSAGKSRPWRHRLFATRIDSSVSPPTVHPVGRPYVDLMRDLSSAHELDGLHIRRAAELAPEMPGGLDIEGLAATPDGRLLVGFRNPLREGRALVVPIDNPAELLAGNGARPVVGRAALLDLGGRGIRSMERMGDWYWIVAGPVADAGSFALYRWDGVVSHPAMPTPLALPTGFHAEAMFQPPGTGEAMLLSDDGTLPVDGIECDRLDPVRQRFRSLRLPLPVR